MEVTGVLKMVGKIVDVGSSGFQKRDCVVTTDEQYPQHILIQFVQDKCNLLANYEAGDRVNIGINLRGREWTNPKGELVYFNTIQGWKIADIQPEYNASPQEKPAMPSAEAFKPQTSANFEEEADDLPF